MVEANLFKDLESRYSNYIAPISMFFYMIVVAACVAGQKLISIFGLIISVGTLIFPITFMIVACITEVYGFRRTKSIIYMGAVCNMFVSVYLYIVIHLKPLASWPNQVSFAQTLSLTSSILLTSTISYVISEYVNAKVISYLRFILKGKWLLLRAIVSTSTAALVDSTLMLPVIFFNSSAHIIRVYLSLIIIKILYSFFLLPLFWATVEFLKKKEGIYQHDTQMPFSSISYMLTLKNDKKYS